jgi:hypothetical protein
MAILSQPDRDVLRAFFRKALELHADGAATTESVEDYLMLVVDAVDRQAPRELGSLRSVLEDAWRQDDG